MRLPVALLFVIAAGTVATARQIEVTTPDGSVVAVTAMTDNIIRVRHTPAGASHRESPLVVLSQPDTTATTGTLGDNYQYLSTSSGVDVTLDNRDGAIFIMGGPCRYVYDRQYVPDSDLQTGAGGKSTLTLSTSGGAFYGAGERAHAFDLTGDTLLMYNRPNYGYAAGDSRNDVMNITMPLLISSEGYALLFDDYATAKLIAGKTVEYISESGQPVDYYFINGNGSIESTVKELSRLTGRQPLPPLWTLGYITSRYGYRSQQETLAVVDSLKSAGYPLDGLVLDLYWYGNEEDMGRLAWKPTQWPDPKAMIDSLNRLNVKTVAISQPYVLSNGRGIDNFNLLSEESLLLNDSTGATLPVEIWVGTGGMFDVSNPATRAWLSDRYRTVLLDAGITGLWGDLGEPEKHPESGLHHNGLPARLYHNLYGNEWSRLASDLLKAERPDERPMVMMRGGTIGLQRYNVFPWSGDVARSWDGMKAQPLIMLQSGLSGLGYMSHDIGGFAVDPEHPSDPEMYQRWLQLGLFSPVLRTHAQSMAEPYNYPGIQPALLDIIRERYAWLPYNYTLAYENAACGLPLVRPVNFYTSTPGLENISDEYLWGRDILVAPVTDPGVTERDVIVPDGIWIDFSSPERTYTLGDTATLAAPINVIPLMVRAGAFIVKAENPMSSTAEYDSSHLSVHYYPVEGVASVYTLYDDDHADPDALAGNAYTLTRFAGEASSDHIEIEIDRDGSYPGMPARLHLDFTINRIVAGRETSVSINGRTVGFHKNADSITFPAEVTDKCVIEISRCTVRPHKPSL